MMALLKGNANIVYCDDICDEPNPDGIGWKLYIRMELLTPLTKALSDPCSEAQVIKVGMDLCNALVACKRKNIIHRDIKPGNIMVAEDGNYKLGDFGVAKTLAGTFSGTKTGTYNFMAPEVYNNQPYGQSADIYSLGMVLYWMLNHRCGPFLPLPPTLPSAIEVDRAQQRRFSGEVLPAPAYGSAALQAVIQKACAYDPAQRYHTPEEMHTALAACVTAKPAAVATTPTILEHTKPQPVAYAESAKYDGNTWESEYDKTYAAVSANDSQGGTVGGTVGGNRKHAGLGPSDIRCQITVTEEELSHGCVKSFTAGNGQKADVTIPAGTKADAVLCVPGAGNQDPATGAKGNAHISLTLPTNTRKDFFGEETVHAEVTIAPHQARDGCGRTVTIDGNKYIVGIPAGASDQQIVKIERKTNQGKKQFCIRIRIDPTIAEPKKKKKPIRWGLILWLTFSVVMLFALPPVGIGCLALSIPFLLNKK